VYSPTRPLVNGRALIDDQALVPALHRLHNLSDLHLDLHDLTDLEFLAGLRCLRNAVLEGRFDNLRPLAHYPELTYLLLDTRRVAHAVDPAPIADLQGLTSLCFTQATQLLPASTSCDR
jgi:hypothetical protein